MLYSNSDMAIENFYNLVPRFCLFKKFPSLETFYHKNLFKFLKLLLGVICSFLSILILFLEIFSLIDHYLVLNIIKYVSEYFGNLYLILFLLTIIIYILFSVYFFMFKFNISDIIGVKWGKKSNLISLYNTSYTFSYFTFPIMINFYNLFLPD